jgi:hypothetical protein
VIGSRREIQGAAHGKRDRDSPGGGLRRHGPRHRQRVPPRRLSRHRAVAPHRGGTRPAGRGPRRQHAGRAGTRPDPRTIPEQTALKLALYRELDAVWGGAPILATNTSSLPLDALADGLKQPDRFVGLHYFQPADSIPLVEAMLGPRMCITGLLEQKDISGLDTHALSMRAIVPDLCHDPAPSKLVQGMYARGESA